MKAIERSTDALFIQQMQHEIDLDPYVRFYLATDSMDVKENFLRQFGGRIITAPGMVSRTSIEGIQDALVELYALSRTQKILGSYWSSYSTTAAQLGNIPLQRMIAKTEM